MTHRPAKRAPAPAVVRVARAALLVTVAATVAVAVTTCGKPAEAPSTPLTSAGGTDTSAEAEAPEAKPTFDYPGGWLKDDACVDICGVTSESPVKRPPAVVCFDPDDQECKAKTGKGDYDYLLLSQHWLPSFCDGLSAGYDSTVTHQDGARCVGDVPNRLTVHGLWPNFTAGFPQCCGGAEPLDPAAALQWPSDLRERLQTAQPDPTTTGFEPALCEIFNHEWQKHGTCYTAGVDGNGDVNADARAYFEAGLDLADQVADSTAAVDAMAGTTQARSSVEALYPKAVQVLCDARKPDRLLEIRTCWSRELEMQDCTETKGFGTLTGCGDEVVLPAG